jgi:hypothetical protein
MLLTAAGMFCADHPQDVGPDRRDRIGCDRRIRAGFRGAQVRSDGCLPMMRKPGEAPGQCDPAASAGGSAQYRGATAARRRAVTRSRWMMGGPDEMIRAIPAHVIAGPASLAG